jgi:Fibronectin type III domain
VKHRLVVAVAAAFLVMASVPAVGGPGALTLAATGCQWTDNLVLNCGFETALDHWTASEPANAGTTSEVPDSSGAVGGSYDGSDAFAGSTDPTSDVTLTQAFTPAAGVAYQASFWYMGGDATSAESWLEASITFGSRTVDLASLHGTGYINVWSEQSNTFVGTGEEATLTFRYHNPTYHWYIDSVAVVPFEATVPDAPVMNADVAVAQGAGQIGMNWTWPDNYGGLDLRGFNVYMGTASGAEDYTTALNGRTPLKDNVYTAGGLIGGQDYYFTVTAVNDLGESAASGETHATAIDVPGAPTGVEAVAGDGSVTLSWTDPDNGGDPTTWYQFYVGSAPDALAPGYSPSASGDGWATITGLENFQTYWFAVVASNSMGQGALSDPVSATPTRPLSVPSAPELSLGDVGNGSISVTWTAPTDDGGSAITGYNVYACTSPGTCDIRRTSSPVTDLSFTIDSLDRNADTYYITVTASNVVGESDPSNEVSAMPVLLPVAPTGVSATTAPAGRRGLSATVTWTDDTSAAVIDNHTVYVYTYRAGNKKSPAGTYRLLASYVTESATTGYLVNGLSSGKTYAFTVSAHNPAGWSRESVYSNPVP